MSPDGACYSPASSVIRATALALLSLLVGCPLAASAQARSVLVLPVQTGDPFDPDLHVMCHARPAPAPEYLGTVANVHASGWATTTDVLRPADVELYVDPR